jgi:hypothetical protein
MESGEGYCFGVVCLFVLPSVLRNFVSDSFSATTGCYSTSFIGIINIMRRCVYRHLVPVRHSELWPLISYAVYTFVEQYSFPRYFSATTGWNSTKLYGNLQYQESMCISSACSGQTLKLRVLALD